MYTYVIDCGGWNLAACAKERQVTCTNMSTHDVTKPIVSCVLPGAYQLLCALVLSQYLLQYMRWGLFLNARLTALSLQ